MSDISIEDKIAVIREELEAERFLPDMAEIETILDQSYEGSEQEARIAKLYELAVRGVHHYDMAFCMMDILGFGNFIDRNTNAKLRFYEDTVLPLLETGIEEGRFASGLMPVMLSRILGLYPAELTQEKSSAPGIEVLTFSDTIIMYPRLSVHTHPAYFVHPMTQIELLNWAVKYLFARMLDRRILLRGSIGYGNCFISQKPLCYLGETIMEVHRTEELQNWGGVIYAPSAATEITSLLQAGAKLHGIVEYDVPVKSDEASQKSYTKLFGPNLVKKYAVDWTLLIDLDIASLSWIDEQAKSTGKENVRQLYQNTRKFYDDRRPKRDRKVT